MDAAVEVVGPAGGEGIALVGRCVLEYAGCRSGVEIQGMDNGSGEIDGVANAGGQAERCVGIVGEASGEIGESCYRIRVRADRQGDGDGPGSGCDRRAWRGGSG